jgi:molecular chaperone DnaK (HSP70)
MPTVMQKLSRAAEAAKRHLSNVENKYAPIKIEDVHEGLDLEFNFLRSGFKIATKHLVESVRAPVENALEQADPDKDKDKAKNKVKQILLVGGSTRPLTCNCGKFVRTAALLPLTACMICNFFVGLLEVREWIQEYFHQAGSDTLNPDECVAEGAAIAAAGLGGIGGGVGIGYVLHDIVPMTIGIAITDHDVQCVDVNNKSTRV